jgi:hypothetical protein
MFIKVEKCNTSYTTKEATLCPRRYCDWYLNRTRGAETRPDIRRCIIVYPEPTHPFSLHEIVDGEGAEEERPDLFT